MAKKITLIFEWDGKTVHKETEGFTGNDCVDETKFIEEALGKSSKRTFKSEYYETEHNKNKDEDHLRY